ncbi:hypothetical protein DHW03_02440 [Pedobacter yonginense]|uniref:HTH araC/xylS-type domain-containing protein n=1 Tax=Pedobacter yonginense TaxID=651869 RepID=A0A317EQG3_9SPHI|nr:helix-turn-helix domain-containing protein [Pedobacter yonginense]PWS28722.1 hypothetical protein DHW03_02440 [Pedobacter yonginense]
MIQLENMSGLYKRERGVEAYYPMRVLIVKEASGFLCMNSGDYELRPGRVFFIPEEGIIRLEANIQSAYWLSFTSYLFLEFLQQHPDPQAKNLFLTLSYKDLDQNKLARTISVVEQLNKDLKLKKDMNFLAQYIYLFLGYASGLDVMMKVLTPDEMQQLLRFRAILEQYFRTERTTGFYAEGMGMSAKRLNTFLENILGKNLLTIIRERLVREAEELLINSEYSIAEISENLGYGRVAAFNATYKKYKGISVAEFMQGAKIEN